MESKKDGYYLNRPWSIQELLIMSSFLLAESKKLIIILLRDHEYTECKY